MHAGKIHGEKNVEGRGWICLYEVARPTRNDQEQGMDDTHTG